MAPPGPSRRWPGLGAAVAALFLHAATSRRTAGPTTAPPGVAPARRPLLGDTQGPCRWPSARVLLGAGSSCRFACYSSPWNPSWLYSTTPGDWSCARSRHWPPSSNYTHDVGCQQGVDGTAMRFSR